MSRSIKQTNVLDRFSPEERKLIHQFNNATADWPRKRVLAVMMHFIGNLDWELIEWIESDIEDQRMSAQAVGVYTR